MSIKQVEQRSVIADKVRVAVLDKRLEALLGELSNARVVALRPALDRILKHARYSLDEAEWGFIAAGLGANIFDDLRIGRQGLQRVVRIMGVADESRLRGPGEVFNLIRDRSMAKLSSLEEAIDIADSGLNDDCDFIREFLFHLYVTVLNSRLQLLYRLYLESHPFPDSSAEDERIAHLGPMEPWAYRLVAESDPMFVFRWLGARSLGDEAKRLAMALNKIHFDPFRVNFRFTHHCNIQCAHCYNFSGPKMKGERIATEKMLSIIRDMPATGMRNMNLTGGEPFMYIDTVLTLIREARSARVDAISIYTNGFFAKTEEGCRKTLARLREAGFMNQVGRDEDHIKVSAGVFHQEFLPFDTIVNLIRVYREMFDKNILVDYEVLESRAEKQFEIERLLRDLSIRDLVDIQFRRITPIGRAAQFDPTMNHLPADRFHNCAVIDEIVFDPDGSVLPCCGMNFGNQGIVIGDIAADSLHTLFRRLENNPILQFIAQRPIRDLFAYRGMTPADKGYADLCSLCHHALGDLKENQELKRMLSEIQDFFPIWFDAEQFMPMTQ